MNRNDFNYTVSAEGYMIQYKGKNIGGAGIQGKYKGSGRARTVQIADYKQQAESTINSICEGRGNKYMLDTIQKIDSEV